MKAAARLIINNIEMLVMFLLPALTGAIILARPLYSVFTELARSCHSPLCGGPLPNLVDGALYPFFTDASSSFENRKAIYYFVYGILIKLVLQIPLIYLLHAYGPLLATTIALVVPIYLMYRRLYQVTHFNRKLLQKRLLLTLIETLLMGLVVFVANWLLGYAFKPTGRLTSLLYLLIIGGVGMTAYTALTLLTHQLDKLIGSKASRLRQKLGWH